jgi:hypothetical protein
LPLQKTPRHLPWQAEAHRLVDDLDAWAARLRDVGAPVLFGDNVPGMRRFYSEDPHGNWLEFLEPLAG